MAAPPDAVDVVGTGGDASGSYNVSTCTAFVVAGAGVPVAKHGNRAFSSRCGAADVLGALGVRIDLEPHEVGRLHRAGRHGLHVPLRRITPALMHVNPARGRSSARARIFNVLGPLINPAGVRRHLVGVYARSWVEPMAEALGTLGLAQRPGSCTARTGSTRITTTGPTFVAALENGSVRTFTIAPGDVGLPRAAAEALRGGDAPHNAAALRAVASPEARNAYRGRRRPSTPRRLLVAAGHAADLGGGLALAERAIDTGEALARLERLVAVSQACVREREETGRLSDLLARICAYKREEIATLRMGAARRRTRARRRGRAGRRAASTTRSRGRKRTAATA